MIFNDAPTEARYGHWLEPRDMHDVDDCEDCHKAGAHDNPMDYFEICQGCHKAVQDRARHATFEFNFTLSDVELAQNWARKNKYRYDDVEHLLLDAMRSNVIHTDKWTAFS